MSIAARWPEAADTIVVGAGTAGAVVAGRLAAGSSERTLLLEAGPDYGPAGSGRWPHDLLDASITTDGQPRATPAGRRAGTVRNKTLQGNRGAHREVPAFELDSSTLFFVRHLGRAAIVV